MILGYFVAEKNFKFHWRAAMANLPAPDTKLDARISRTLASIERAFFELLEQKAYGDITVQDILSHANINRTTFYKYYENKDDLANTIIANIKQNLFEPLLSKRLSTSWQEFVKELPTLVNDCQHHKIRLLWQISTPRINLKKDVYELIKNIYTSTIKGTPNDDLSFQGHLYASFCLAVIEHDMHCQTPTDNHSQRHHDLKQVFAKILH